VHLHPEQLESERWRDNDERLRIVSTTITGIKTDIGIFDHTDIALSHVRIIL
jgi:hypothetical protein